MDELEYFYTVNTRTEGTVLPNQAITQQMTNMGAETFSHGLTGKLKVIVEMENQQITKNKVVFVEGTSREFETQHTQAANQVLTDAIALVQANGDNNGNGEIKVIVKGKK